MGSFYDEDLHCNVFFKALQRDYGDIFHKAIYEGCLICVPRAGSLTAYGITLDDVLGHVLIPNDEMPESHFTTLNGRIVKIGNKIATLEYEERCQFNTHILFEETYYTQDLFKYKVLCIEYPLAPKTDRKLDGVLELRTLRDCIDLLWTESSNKSNMEYFDDAVKEFQGTNFILSNVSIQWLVDITRALYSKCLGIVFKDAFIKDQATSNMHILRNVKLAVETYMHHGIYKVLFNEISACTSQEDSQLNKVIRNSKDLQLRDLDIRSELYDLIPKARIELSKISGYSTVLGKTSCLRKMIQTLSNGVLMGSSLAVDDLLPAIIFILIKSNVSNWFAHLNYIKHFHHARCKEYACDDDDFLVTTLEAALEHIKSGIFSSLSGPEGNVQVKSSNENMLVQIFREISLGNLPGIREFFETRLRVVHYGCLPLCHPLCACDNCNQVLSTSSESSSHNLQLCDDAGITPLHVAAMYGKPLIIDYLLSQKADVKCTDVSGYTPMHYAAMRGHQSVILLLAQSGADVNLVDNAHNTALHLSTNNGHEGCVKALIYHSEHAGINLLINAQNVHGDTPLHNAATWGFLTMVQLLVDSHADPNLTNRKRLSPFDVSNNYKVWEILSKAKVQRSNQQVQRPLTYDFIEENPKKWSECGDIPVSSERLRRVDKLLRSVARGDTNLACFYLGLNPKNAGADSCHPLCSCPQCYSYKPSSPGPTKNVLSVSECNFEGFTPLHMAASHGCLDIAKILISNGALLDAQTRNKLCTPLILACQNQRVHVAKLLVESGCKVDSQDCQGNSPLHYAVEQGSRLLVQTLLTASPSLLLKNKNGKTALQVAEDDMALSIVNLLQRNGGE